MHRTILIAFASFLIATPAAADELTSPWSSVMTLALLQGDPDPEPTPEPDPEVDPDPDGDPDPDPDDPDGDDDDDDDDGTFDTGELTEDQDTALKEWEEASRKQAEQQIKRGYTLAGGGAVVAAGAAYFTVAGVGVAKKRDDASQACADLNDPQSQACQDAIRFSSQTSTNYALGAALGVAGLTLAAVGAHNVSVGRRVRAELAVDDKSAMLILHGEF